MEAKSPELVALGQAIRDLRNRSGLSQQDAATKSGINRTYLGQVENGRRNPTFATLIWIARTLDISLVELVRALTTSARGCPATTARNRLPGSPKSHGSASGVAARCRRQAGHHVLRRQTCVPQPREADLISVGEHDVGEHDGQGRARRPRSSGAPRSAPENRPESLTSLRATNGRRARQERSSWKCTRSSESDNAPDRIRTCDLRFRRPTLYPAELRAQDSG